MGVEKYEKLGIPYPLKGIEPPTSEMVARARMLLGI
jgi:pyruvate formate lyase activating enzyme